MKLLEHFHELSLHPQNAKELKALILQLAVQGKLTRKWRAENPNYEDSTTLLDEIKVQKEQLIRNKKIKKEKKLPKITKEEIPYTLPKGWCWCRFEDIGVPQPGFSFKSKDFNRDGVGIPLIRIRDLHKTNVETYYSGEYRSEFLVYNGEYLVGMDGNFNIAQWNKGVALLNQRLCRLYFISDEIVKDFFIYSLQFELWALQGTKSYTTVDHLSGKQIRASKIPFPPLAEQKAIVSIVEQLFAEVEQLEALTEKRVQLKENFAVSALNDLVSHPEPDEGWQSLQPHFHRFFNEESNLQKLRETILTLAVQGKLTRKWRSENPELIEGPNAAPALLERIKAEKARLVKEKKIRKEKALPPISEDEIPYELPEGWVWCRIENVLDSFIGGFAYKSTRFIEYSDYQVLRLGNVKNDYLRFESKPVFIDKNYAEETSDYCLRVNDILITMTGTRAKRDYCFTALIEQHHLSERLLFLNQRVGCLRFNSNCSSKYINQALKSNVILDSIFNKATGTANQANVGKYAILEAAIPLPPYEEQKAIVAKVKRLMALCDELEAQVSQSKQQAEDLMQAVVREVFEGKKEYELEPNQFNIAAENSGSANT